MSVTRRRQKRVTTLSNLNYVEYSPPEAGKGCNAGVESSALLAIARGKASGFVICRGGGDGEIASLGASRGARLGVTRVSLFVELS